MVVGDPRRRVRWPSGGISDGDTLTVQTDDNQRVRVRLAGIDAPEHDQPYGTAATHSLAALALNRTVRVRRVAEDDYGRMVGVVVADGRDLDAEQVRRGMAWVYRRYSRSRHLYALEAEAKQARRGLWADSNPIPPWDWRHGGKSRSRHHRRRPPFSAGRSALGEMTSCEEARFYLDRCGVKGWIAIRMGCRARLFADDEGVIRHLVVIVREGTSW